MTKAEFLRERYLRFSNNNRKGSYDYQEDAGFTKQFMEKLQGGVQKTSK